MYRASLSYVALAFLVSIGVLASSVVRASDSGAAMDIGLDGSANLDRRFGGWVKDIALGDLFTEAEWQSGVAVRPDWQSLASWGLKPDTRVSVPTDGTSIMQVLERAVFFFTAPTFGPRDPSFLLVNGTLFVATAGKLAPLREARTLIATEARSKKKFGQLLDAVSDCLIKGQFEQARSILANAEIIDPKSAAVRRLRDLIAVAEADSTSPTTMPTTQQTK